MSNKPALKFERCLQICHISYHISCLYQIYIYRHNRIGTRICDVSARYSVVLSNVLSLLSLWLIHDLLLKNDVLFTPIRWYALKVVLFVIPLFGAFAQQRTSYVRSLTMLMPSLLIVPKKIASYQRHHDVHMTLRNVIYPCQNKSGVLIYKLFSYLQQTCLSILAFNDDLNGPRFEMCPCVVI